MVLVLVFAAIGLILLGRVQRPRDFALWCGFPLLYFLLAEFSKLNLGERYILPVYPFVLLLCGSLWSLAKGRRVVQTRFEQAEAQEVGYDSLIVAAGASHAYFGHEEWQPLAPGLKTVEDALEIRRRVLLAFELAERQAAAGGSSDPLNFAVVGGGPTGVELAGTLAEICRHALTHEFRSIDPSRAHILLLEGGPRVLPAYTEDLSRSAQDQLHRLGVEVRTSAIVTQIEPGAVYVGDTRLPATVILWAAGVAASPLGKKLGVPVDRAGRVPVQPDLSIPGHPEVFVIGDLAAAKDATGKLLPGVAPVAIQQGQYVAKLIRKEVDSPGSPSNATGAPFLASSARSGNSDPHVRKDHPPLGSGNSNSRPAFHYWDKGSLATIGRAAAVAQFGRIHISGFIAWLAWLFVHILFLIGFRNRLLVFIQWAWSYVTYERGARLITGSTDLPGWTPAQPPVKSDAAHP